MWGPGKAVGFFQSLDWRQPVTLKCGLWSLFPDPTAKPLYEIFTGGLRSAPGVSRAIRKRIRCSFSPPRLARSGINRFMAVPLSGSRLSERSLVARISFAARRPGSAAGASRLRQGVGKRSRASARDYEQGVIPQRRELALPELFYTIHAHILRT